MGVHLAAALLLVSAIQPPSADTIARQLESADARAIAWGAYTAGAYHRDEMIPRLQRILESPPPSLPEDQRALVGVVMDALIQLKARVPARVLAPYITIRPVHTLVLLSSAPDRQGVLLELLPRLSEFQWFAAANMLFEDRSPGLVEYLVRTVRLELIVYVSDTEEAGFGGGALGVTVGCGIGQDPPGYPPHAEYRFEYGPGAGFLVLSTGPHPVYYSRTVTASFQYPVSELLTGGPSDEDRMEYLRAMSHELGWNPLRAETTVSVRWSTSDALLQRVRELRSETEQRFKSIINGAGRFRPLPPDLPVQPAIKVRLVDRRSDKAVPLPSIGQ